MTWQDRLKETIELTSPEGNTFSALWMNDSRTLEKRLGIFNYPSVQGTAVQDLGVTGTQYPITLYFEGSDNDLESNKFLKACAEKGLWKIIHPAKGILNLQLVSVTEAIAPTTSGNLTKFETEWIETIESNSLQTTPQLASQIIDQSNQLNDTSSEQFVANVVQDTSAQTAAIKKTTNNLVGVVTSTLKSLYETVPELNSRMTLTIAGIQDTITQTTIDTISLAGQIQTLVTLPVLATTDVIERVSAYSAMILAALGLSPDDTSQQSRNIVSVQELGLTSALVAVAQSVSTGLLATRNQSVEMAVTVSTEFQTITDALDATQELFIANDIDLQYFSQSASFSDVFTISAQAIGYLLLSAYDLAVEKTITLEKPEAPIMVAVQQYGSFGENDSNVDLFLESNNLKANEIMILPAGRQVVVYV